MHIGIFYNSKTNPNNKPYALEIAKVLDDHRIPYLINPEQTKFRITDIAFAVGGDGTVLHVANLLAHSDTPIIGINFGHRGFLCEMKREDVKSGIENLMAMKYTIEEKTRIQAKIRLNNDQMITLEALNEISIGGINRTVHLKVDILSSQKTIVTEITGDGLIIATRTGSTAYNINAGGPMLLTDALSVVANNAFFESDKLLPITNSIVVPTEAIIRIHDLGHNPANLPYVIADGQESFRLGQDSKVTIRRSEHTSRFIKF